MCHKSLQTLQRWGDSDQIQIKIGYKNKICCHQHTGAQAQKSCAWGQLSPGVALTLWVLMSAARSFAFSFGSCENHFRNVKKNVIFSDKEMWCYIRSVSPWLRVCRAAARGFGDGQDKSISLELMFVASFWVAQRLILCSARTFWSPRNLVRWGSVPFLSTCKPQPSRKW